MVFLFAPPRTSASSLPLDEHGLPATLPPFRRSPSPAMRSSVLGNLKRRQNSSNSTSYARRMPVSTRARAFFRSLCAWRRPCSLRTASSVSVSLSSDAKTPRWVPARGRFRTSERWQSAGFPLSFLVGGWASAERPLSSILFPLGARDPPTAGESKN